MEAAAETRGRETEGEMREEEITEEETTGAEMIEVEMKEEETIRGGRIGEKIGEKIEGGEMTETDGMTETADGNRMPI